MKHTVSTDEPHSDRSTIKNPGFYALLEAWGKCGHNKPEIFVQGASGDSQAPRFLGEFPPCPNS
eukprot:m.437644 g.437644  ORF g.437644 m.437644 type:complete len:64 (-) comp18138_c0_seq1:70-261(-)